MSNKITNTATLNCDKGTISSQLAVTSQSFCYLDNKLIATVNDKSAFINIKPFGQCLLKPSIIGYLPCTPSPTSWQKATAKDEIAGSKILTEESVCPCVIGGIIKVQDKGHSEEHNQK